MYALRKGKGGFQANPIRWGWSEDIVSENISELRGAGYQRKQAVAIAFEGARQSYRARYPRRKLPEHIR